jgi:hypothetical protein
MRSKSRAAWLSLAMLFTFASIAQAQSLKAENAQVQDKFIVVKSVEAPSEGWLVAHKDDSGKPGEIVGFMMIKAGNNSSVQIPLAGMLDPGAGIILMLHEDGGAKGTFDPKEDKPTMEGGKPVMAEVKIE